MSRTTINSLGIPADTIVSADLDYPLTDFSSTGIDDNATATALTIDSSGNIAVTGNIAGPSTFTIDPAGVGDNTGTLVIAGNLQVDGTTTTINSTTMTVDDLNITLASGAANAAAANGAGITVEGASATLTYNSTPDAWSFNKNVGIGIDSPTEKLTVRGDVTLAPNSTSAADRLASLTVGKRDSGTSGYMGKMEFVGSGTNGFATDIVFSSKTGDFYNSTTNEHMRIDSSGNVGIGTDAPDDKLAVVGTISVQDSGVTTDSLKITASTGSSYQNTITHGNTGLEFNNNSTSRGYSWATNGTLRMRIDSSGNVGIGAPAVSGVNAPLDVDKAPVYNNCIANFGEFVPISGYQRGVVNINGRVNGSDYSASLSMVVRNSSNSNWLNGRIVYNNLNEFIIEKNGIAATAPVEQMKIDAGGRQTLTHNQYSYGGGNYFIKSATGAGNSYLGNVNGSLVLSSNGYYYGAALRQLDAGKTNYSEVILNNLGGISFSGLTGATAGSAATAARYASIDADGLKFGTDTAAANALDDYEEGTWDCRPSTSTGSVSVHSGLTVSNYNGTYTKVGRLVTLCYYFEWSNTSTDTSAVYLVLPFTAKQYLWSGNGTEVSKPTFPSGRTYITVRPEQNNSYASFKACGSAATRTDMTGNLFFANAGGYALGSFSYFTDS